MTQQQQQHQLPQQQQQQQQSHPEPIFFSSHKNESTGFLSSFYSAPFFDDGVLFSGASHYIIYRKALLFEDKDMAALILATANPFMQYRLGRRIKGFKEKTWKNHRKAIVKRANQLKFCQHPHLLVKLCNLSGDIVQASKTDSIWGIGLTASEAKTSRKKWGENLMGKSLMELRKEFLKF